MSSTTVHLGRIPVVDVAPVVEHGTWPAKAVVGEVVPVEATVFREGHDAVAATAVLVSPTGKTRTARMVDVAPGLDRFRAEMVPDELGEWMLRVEGWSDPVGTWVHDATIKIEAGVDVDLMLAEGAALFTRAATRPRLPRAEGTLLRGVVRALKDTKRPPLARLAVATSPEVLETLERNPLRDMVSPSPAYRLVVDRPLALTGAWYEFFPRSEGATQDPETGEWTSGTFDTAAERLPAIAAMGFDVVYLTPIHPIGTTNRKGRNNTLTTVPGDPGSPYGIGSADGGHDAIHPELGTFDDFDRFVDRARDLGLEVALDIALQCSPDHPWVTEHPEWFTTRVDGSIAYAENPPKKYQDIYPLNFDNDPEGIYTEILRMLRLWIRHGVTAFRVDNPHTKPLPFWERLLLEIRRTDPDVVFLSEAFTKPAMMHTLAKIGFHQSYTYFTWRNTKEELEEYLQEVSGSAGAYMRPSFWPTTHDILPPYLQHGGVAAFAIRAVLAATASPTWGIYSGYELAERVPRPGVEEQIDNEKYEFKPRDWSQAEDVGISLLLTRLNEIRRAHPALRQLRNLTVHPTTDDSIIAFSSHLAAEHSPTGVADTVITVVNLDPHATRAATLHLDLEALGIPSGDTQTFAAHDLLTSDTYAWGAQPFVQLDPYANCAHIIHVRPL
ncbi:alpha-1,4-glucan--maltose-1-phosphate maltosyltransferase [Sanguibacter suaedae]|uniref:Alpha-1,4-glucan:maltose-1-phosphate maltosyltransferase n=1 Tax=Sanguibacter suaedae TaxID=2795737 RepID=A0A934I5N9_9MICO|nr:alpha-1,4-glucan--maltose-1-phosphate maltosyltransferase [Sanguibacter suaedae]MBI9116074.1 alpha-1,4-glucan--maltose-1-phosphate maltosyltransferase [Sanguibacter suaedae]